jgi:hypothetical protein
VSAALEGRQGRKPAPALPGLEQQAEADSTISDIVHPCRAAASFKRVMTDSSMLSGVFIWFTIKYGWKYVKLPGGARLANRIVLTL